MRLTKALKEIEPIASAHGLEFVGHTSKGHYRWRHSRSGRILVTVSTLTSFHALKNTERQIKRFIREMHDGQHANEN